VIGPRPSVLSFGGGVNSTALLVGLAERVELPHLVLFSDTGGERPATYRHVEHMAAWCAVRGVPFVTVTNGGRGQGATLEENCLTRKELPSLAYGFKGCSSKWKRQPMDRYVREWAPAVECWENGGKVLRLIGIDAGESHRAVLTEDAKHVYRYPLVEWGWTREECVTAIRAAGLEVPPKSSCFFCPAMRRAEVLRLAEEEPDLFARAVAIEANAETHTVVGLGRNWKWADLVRQDKAQGKLWGSPEIPCGCMDESDNEQPKPEVQP